MSYRRILSCGLLVLAVLAAGAARAEHEADHRYSIRGYVLDASEKPIVGARVSATVGEHGGQSARTDDDGFYTINLHLHDADIGSDIELRVGEVAAMVRMQAERGDQHEERIHWASFVGTQLREDALGRFQMPGWGWALLGFGGLVAALVAGVRVQRVIKRRRRAADTPARPAPKTRQGRKRRR